MRNLVEKFTRWYRLTHWLYHEDKLRTGSEGDFTDEITDAMYNAYCAGYNKAKRDNKTNTKKKRINHA
jgi:hypothetical protein